MDKWLRLLQAAASKDRNSCIHWSLELGYLTGDEHEVCPVPKIPYGDYLDAESRLCSMRTSIP